MSGNLRQILHSAYTYVRSQEANKATAAITLDHLIQERIKSLKTKEVIQILNAKGQSVGNRTSRYDQLTDLQKSIDDVVSAIQAAGNDPVKLEQLGLLPEENE
jgi:hypothetical protein